MPLPAAVLLGIIQGITEFLPVSSSAHLILARAFFGWEVPPEFGLAFDVALHVGTLAATVAYFRSDVIAMVKSLPLALSRSATLPARLARLIVIGTIPVVIVGITFNDFIEQVLRTPTVAAAALAIGAIAMLIGERLGERPRTIDDLRWSDALLIGCAQASALIPGMSRSGSTIAMALFLGVRRDSGARFTFLLAIPAMVAAAAKEALELRTMPLPADSLGAIVAGLIVSAIVGYLTIKYFLLFLGRHRLDVFAGYRLLLAAATVVWLVTR